MEFNLLIRNGLVFDGSTKPPVKADVGIIGDRIQDIGDLRAATAREEIDADGEAVAPGFIDTHTHSDLAWTLEGANVPVAAAAVVQGVTTEICGNCGFSPFPHLPEHRADLERHMTVLFGGTSLDWSDLAGFADTAGRAGVHANLAPLVGHGSVRVGVLGFENRPPREDELQAMKRLVEEALAHALVASGKTTAGATTLAQYVAAYLAPEHRDRPGQGCPLTALVCEMPRQSEGVRARFTAGVRGMLKHLGGRLKPELKRSQRDEQALATVASLVGAIVLARAVDDPELSDAILRATRKQLVD